MLFSLVMRFVEPSREFLAETLVAAGPGAPTLCRGWQSQDLAAHLYLRERNPAIGLGVMLRPFAKVSESATKQLAEKSNAPETYTELVDRFRAGPPSYSPLKIKSLDESANLIEYFVHAEDIRRAGNRWAPRVLSEDYAEVLWEELLKRAAILYRGIDVGIILVQPNGPRHVVRRAPVSVAVIGEPGELIMHAHGRTSHALVHLEGEADAITLLKTADVGI